MKPFEGHFILQNGVQNFNQNKRISKGFPEPFEQGNKVARTA